MSRYFILCLALLGLLLILMAFTVFGLTPSDEPRIVGEVGEFPLACTHLAHYMLQVTFDPGDL